MKEATQLDVAVSFVRWAGSKRRLLSQIRPHLPRDYNTYIEPFLGGGSLFLDLQPSRALLNDACAPLVDTWNAIRTSPSKVYDQATKLPLDSENYYRERSLRGGTRFERAGRFIYLNRGAFNGLYRVNLRGEFNVPWGAPKTPNIITLSQLKSVAAVLNNANVTVTCGDFEEVIDRAVAGDLVFLDPPYVTSHNENGFAEYNEKIFSWADQERLATAAKRAVDRGAVVVVTNANHASVLELYPTFTAIILERASTLAASASRRGRTTEILLMGRNGRVSS